ncbi:hypothetical protein [Alteribacillus sp. HJP-4]|uniref:hypothetical protein n=1 Tax=Alteribacillus sp. HJP-4 TaxID=2775394 RepID=UPI0035CCEFDA
MRVIIKTKDTKEYFSGYFDPVTSKDLKSLALWFFNWLEEYDNPNRQVYKLTIAGNDVIQAAISFEYRDGYVLVENLESANWGKESKSGINVAPTMLAAVN